MDGMTHAQRIYLDYASATPILPAALDVLHKTERVCGNPGGLHADAVAAKKLLQRSRERIASELACKAREVVFVSGLTEANALSIVGAARALERARRTLQGTHWIVSSIEHSSVLDCFAEVERMGGTVSHVDPNEHGIIRPEHIAAALKPETVFVSIGWGNNEIGTIQPLSRIARVIRAHQKAHGTTVLFHSDAGQAPLYLAPHVHTLGVDLFALGSGKLYGPRGIGCLFVGPRTSLSAILFGGGQERGLRPGTEEPVLAAGFAEAFACIAEVRAKEAKRVRALRDELARQLQAHHAGIVVNGDPRHTLPHMLNISVPGERSGEYLALRLDHFGLSLSTKSACREGEAASHVVAALGNSLSVASWRAKHTLRFSLGLATTAKDIKQVVAICRRVIPAAR